MSSSSAPPPPLPTHVIRVHKSPISTIFISDDNERLYSGDNSGFVAVTSTRTFRSIVAWNAHKDGLLGVEEWDDVIITHARDNKLSVWNRDAGHPSIGGAASVVDQSTPTLRFTLEVNALNFCRFSLLEIPNSPAGDVRSALIALPNLVDSSLADIWILPYCDRLHAAIGKRGQSSAAVDGRDTKTGILMSIHLYHAMHPSASTHGSLNLLAGYESGKVICWRYGTPERMKSVEGRGWEPAWTVSMHVESVMAMTVSRDKTFALTTSADHIVGRYELMVEPGNEAAGHSSHKIKQVGNGALSIRDDGRVCAIGGWDGKLRLFSTKSMKPLGTLEYHKGACQTVAFAHSLQDTKENTDASEDDDDGMTQEEKIARSRWLVVGGADHRLSVWELMTFAKK